MADSKHLKIVKKGVKAWNQWRLRNPNIQPDLSATNIRGARLREADLSVTNFLGADLREANFGRAILSGVDLRRADLSGADLSGANLNEANINEADLSGANLFRADLSGADLIAANLGMVDLRAADLIGTNLRSANISGANLGGANLSMADLRGANLSDTNLTSADLSEANLVWANLLRADLTASIVRLTDFGNVDLSKVKGLESVRHEGPSIISIDTIYKSKGNIPEIFLRGVGVPDVFIANMKSLVAAMSPIQFYSCFISYSTKDQEFAERLYADLQAKGVRCWLATEDLKIGEPFRQVIDDAIRRYDKLMVVLSETSVASTWVKDEVEAALEKERAAEGRTVLFPIRLDEAVMKTEKAWAAHIRRQRHMGDFRRWQNHVSYQKAFQRLLRDLKGVKTDEGEG